ncbi:phosphatidylinositol-3-phosphate-binding protein BEM1 [Rhodotorula paludigena]|uniref:phosphatidylinositol-3-phosphate-binding protein BEM1 n=1 Tax=Rhodotorula paludigena TaxID=86838 RepID=UPI00316FB8B7
MKGIRRSLNKDRIGAPASSAQGGKTAVPPPSAYSQRPSAAPAPAPPKRVIRATAAYRAQSPQELSFESGDFFHVVSDEGGDEWFDAANPMTGARGLVPASHFQVLGRNVRETAMQGQGGPGKKTSIGSAGGSSGPSSPYGAPGAPGWKAGAPALAGAARQTSVDTGRTPNSASPSGSAKSAGRPPSQPAPKHQPLYGVVQYDFVAERPDELDAKRGEPIIVIAQSNHEWFVAKPIGRLGGPGLIPVAFVEIQDMATGKPVENVEELIRSAVVPKVEEWKKMTADYKQASIPLGRFDFGQPSDSTASSASTSAAPTSTVCAATPSSSSAQQQPARSSYDNHHQYSQQYQSPTGETMSPQGDAYDPRYSYSRERRQYGLVTSASVESFHQEEGSFWFHLRAFFSTGASLVLYRLYQDFYDFQIALMDEFPVEAGRLPGDDGRTERILPMMPGPTEYEDEVVCAQRVHDLSIYLSDLCALPERIRGSGLMYEFLVPRAGDVEVSPGHAQVGDEPSPVPSQGIENQYGELVDYLDQLDGGGGGGAAGQARQSGEDQRGYANNVAEQMGRMSLNGSRGDGQYGQQDDYRRQSAQRDRQQPQQDPYYSSAPAPPMGNANVGVPFIKIKIFHRNTDDLIAIRVPPTVSHAALLDKVRERLGSDVTQLRFREEAGAGGAQFVSLLNDLDLERWVRSGAKLVLYAD